MRQNADVRQPDPSQNGSRPQNGSRRNQGIASRMIGAVVGPLVSPVVDQVDIDDIVSRVDVDNVIQRVDLDGVIARVDLDSVLSRVDMNALLERVDVNELVARIDLDAVLDRVDINLIVARLDLDTVLDRVDIDRLMGRIDLDTILDRVDLDRVVDRIQIDHILDRVDIDRILNRIDLNAIVGRLDLDAVVAHVDLDAVVARLDINKVIDRVDIDAVVARVDLNKVIDHVDIDAVVARVDVNKVLERVDTDAIIQRTEFGALIAHSTGGVLTKVLDVARTQVVTVDIAVHGLTDRVTRRGKTAASPTAAPASPVETEPTAATASPAVTEPTAEPAVVVDTATPDTESPAETPSSWHRDLALQGRPAGAVSRLLAFLVDWFLIGTLFALGQSLLSAGTEVILGHSWHASDHQILSGLFFLLWAFAYFTMPIGLGGRTPGKALLGLRVVRTDGGAADLRHAALRTLVLPFSIFIFGIGLFMGVFRRDRRTLHDLAAGTHEIYSWDARGAELRVLAGQKSW
jgi:uncharacterized RDD family membrane protein YckC